MGCYSSKNSFRKFEFKQFAQETNLNYEQVEQLFEFFIKASKSQIDDGVIDYQEFCQCFKLRDDFITQRLFYLFDINSDHAINFREFVQGIHKISSTNLMSVIEILFKCIDIEGKGQITEQQVGEYLNQLCNQNEGVQISKKLIEEMVHAQFDEILIDNENCQIIESEQENIKSNRNISRDANFRTNNNNKIINNNNNNNMNNNNTNSIQNANNENNENKSKDENVNGQGTNRSLNERIIRFNEFQQFFIKNQDIVKSAQIQLRQIICKCATPKKN